MACTSGLLAFGTLRTLSIYTLVMDDGLLTWSQKWSRKHDAYITHLHLPDLLLTALKVRRHQALFDFLLLSRILRQLPKYMHFSLSVYTNTHDIQEDHLVRIYSTPSGRLSQRIPHARRCTDIGWRNTDTGSGSRYVAELVQRNLSTQVTMIVIRQLCIRIPSRADQAYCGYSSQ